jgi:hypothetical protein
MVRRRLVHEFYLPAVPPLILIFDSGCAVMSGRDTGPRKGLRNDFTLAIE